MVAREEAGFDRTLRAGLSRLEEAFATGTKVLEGDVAFTLHDTHGFPVELTEELARDAGVEVDRAGFDAAMAEQRERARAAAKSTRAGDEAAYRALLDAEGSTAFVGRDPEHYEVPARVLAVLEGDAGAGDEDGGKGEGDKTSDKARDKKGEKTAEKRRDSRRRPTAAPKNGWSRSSWTARPSTPRAVARWGTPGPS